MKAQPTPFSLNRRAAAYRRRGSLVFFAMAFALTGCKTMPAGTADAAGGVVTALNGNAAAPATAPLGSPGCKRLGGNSNVQNAAIGAAGGAAVGAAIGSGTARKSSVGARNGALLGAMVGALAGSQYNNMVGMTEQDDGSVKMNIPGAVLFRSGSADLNPNFQQTLNQVAATIREYCGLTASVIGHTDSTGSSPTNERLSRDRAAAVVAYLRGQAVDGSRLTSDGRASREPVASNGDEAGRAQNRRVEIFIRPSAT